MYHDHNQQNIVCLWTIKGWPFQVVPSTTKWSTINQSPNPMENGFLFPNYKSIFTTNPRRSSYKSATSQLLGPRLRVRSRTGTDRTRLWPAIWWKSSRVSGVNAATPPRNPCSPAASACASSVAWPRSLHRDSRLSRPGGGDVGWALKRA